MTFLQLKQRLGRRRNANDLYSSPAVQARYGDAINEAYHAILRKPWATRLRDTTTTKASVASTQSYSVTSCARINAIWDPLGRIKLTMRTLQWLREHDPVPQSGTPVVWIPTDVTKTTQTFLLWPTPAAIITYSLDITSPITEMSVDTDVPLLPDDFHDLLIDGAELRELRKADDPNRWSMVNAAYTQGERDLCSWLVSNPDWTPTAEMPEFSSLGAMYPNGS